MCQARSTDAIEARNRTRAAAFEYDASRAASTTDDATVLHTCTSRKRINCIFRSSRSISLVLIADRPEPYLSILLIFLKYHFNAVAITKLNIAESIFIKINILSNMLKKMFVLICLTSQKIDIA